MKKNKIEEIKQLIDNKLSDKESKKLIAEIKNNEELKLEFSLLTKIKKNSREKLKEKLKTQIEQAATFGTAAALQLDYISGKAAFSQATATTCKPEDLPVSDETIDEFLEED